MSDNQEALEKLQPPTALEPLDPEVAARATLALLETRLQRLEFLLTGISDPDGRPISTSSRTRSIPSASAHDLPQEEEDHQQQQSERESLPAFPSNPSHSLSSSSSETVPQRLQKLETNLHRLKRLDGPAGNLVRSVDALQKRHPDLFTTSSNIQTGYAPEKPKPSLDTISQYSASVLAHAPLYHRTSAHLQTLQTLPVPPASLSTNLINTAPKLKELLHRQAELEREAQSLRERSAQALEWWVKVGVVGMGEVWEDWESRVKQVHKQVRLMEARKRRAEQG